MWARLTGRGPHPRWRICGGCACLLVNLCLLLAFYKSPPAVHSLQEETYRVIDFKASDLGHDERITSNSRPDDIHMDVDNIDEYYQKFHSDKQAEKSISPDQNTGKSKVLKYNIVPMHNTGDYDLNYDVVPQNPAIAQNAPSVFHFHTRPKTDMCHNELFLLILVCSAVQRVDLRDAIRNTWGSVEQRRPLGIELFFVLGNLDVQNEHFRSTISREIASYGDILQIDYEDSYKTLSAKTLGALSWVSEHCNGAKFVMKTDDDVFINLHNLAQDLAPRVEDRPVSFMLGHVIDGAKPIKKRSDKWFMPDSLYKESFYPKYLSGTAYVMPFNIIPYIIKASKNEAMFWLEDVYITGILGKILDISLVNNDKFLYKKQAGMDPCLFQDIIASHEMAAPDLYQIWKDMARHGLDCNKQNNGFHMNGNIIK